MLLITCPHCGPRNRTEFLFGGDASLKRPDESVTAFEDGWYDFIYLRDNVRGPHLELWQHRAGCRMWLAVERDTLTHRIGSVVLASALRVDAATQKVTA